MPQRSFQRRLHLHVAEFGDGEVEVVKGFSALVGVVLEQQFGELEAGEGDLGAKTDLDTELEGLVLVGAGFSGLAEERRGRTKMASWAGEYIVLNSH